MKYVNTFGFKVFSDELAKIQLTDNCKTCNTISPNSYGISTKDPQFRDALKTSDYLVLDGVYFALASLALKGKKIKKNQGPDLFKFFVRKLNKESGRIFFLGSSNETLDRIKTRLSDEYPNIKVEYLSPPFKKEFSEADNSIMVEAINKFKPDILFIGMTCPKQEKWSHEHKASLNAKLVCSIGAVFDWYAGNQKEIHPLWWKFNMAWLKRTIDRPEILLRYPEIGIFFWHLFLALFGINKYK